MKHSIPVISVILLCLLISSTVPGFCQQAKVRDLNTVYKEAMQAYKQKDYKKYLATFKELDSMRPNHPTILYNLAGAFSLNNDAANAVKFLWKLIPINANPKIATDTDFNPIKKDPAFKKILAQIKVINTPIANSQLAFTLKERDLHVESIAYDPLKKRFYFSSVHKRKIVYFQDGKLKDFTTTAQDGLDAAMGIRVDPKERILWVTSNVLPQMDGYRKEDRGRTGLFKYNLDSGKFITKYILKEGPRRGIDDLAIHPKGDIYLSENTAVYRLKRQGENQLERFIADPQFRSLQGIDFCAEGKKVIAADWSNGLYLLDIASAKVESVIQAPAEISLKGIDGLYYIKQNNSLIVIQNGIRPMRIIQLFLDSQFRQVRRYQIIERANPLFNEPTLGVPVKPDTFYYIANSQWNGYDKNSQILPLDKLQDIIILKTKIMISN